MIATLPDRAAVIRAIEPEVDRLLALLPSPGRAWQPSQYLPDFAADTWHDELRSLRRDAARLPDDLLVVLVGDAVTEEALPSYSMALNEMVRDGTGTGAAPWARWLRGWTAEENRHGDLLNAYLRLSGRVDMAAVERTIHSLVANGFDAGTSGDPYNLLVYTSFQERATRISHANVARLAERDGVPGLSRICRVIAADEARHETFYSRMMQHVLDLDPDGGILSFRAMLKTQIAMPGRLMEDGEDDGLFDRFARVAQRSGVYTAADYAAIVEHLLATWRIAERAVSGEAARAQEELCRFPGRCAALVERTAARLARAPHTPFSWIFSRAV
jgi:acyl-[acyl-carrier-protein] desaturase